MMKYGWRDGGSPSTKEITYGAKVVGYIFQHADGWHAMIAKLRAPTAPTVEDAFSEIMALHLGQDIDDIYANSDGFLDTKVILSRAVRVIQFLRDNARANYGTLEFTHDDLAILCGWEGPAQRRPLGSVSSLVDFAYYKAWRPPLGCAIEPFKNAWQRDDRTWDFPVPRMREAAETHIWTDADFDLILRETQKIKTGSAPKAWGDAIVAEEAKIKEWCETVT